MKQIAVAPLAVAALILAACQPPAEAPADAPAATVADAPATAPAAPAPASGPAYAPTEGLLASNGVTFPNPGGRGTGLEVAFGRAEAEVIVTLTQFRGAAPTLSENGECGAGPLKFATWDDGLQLLFQNGAFVGWAAGSQTPRGFRTNSGIGIGSTQAQLRAAHPGVEIAVSSLGPEFGADDVYGLFSGSTPTATVTNLWAGVSCNFR